MNPIKLLKRQFRSTAIHRYLLRRRAVEQEEEYLQLSNDAYSRLPDAFTPPGYLARSKRLLKKNWPGPRTVKSAAKDVHILVLNRPNMAGPWFEAELARHFKITAFSITRHRLGFIQGKSDLISYSCGIDPADRLRRNPPFPEDFADWHTRLQKDILEIASQAHKRFPVDLCFAYGTPKEFEPETFHQIRATGIPVALWYLDEKHGFTARQAPLIGSYDVHLSNSFEPLRWYMARGAAAYYFPQAIDPEIYHPRQVERDIPVSFVGAAYGWRLDFIEELKKAGIPVECFGPGWENGVVDDLVNVFCRSQINLGMGFTGQSRRLTCIKERDFQVPATGSLYLTTYDPELTRLFDVGQEILCYRNEMDCIEQIRYYLAQPNEATAIAHAGRERCLRDHTWTHRMERLFNWMGILKHNG